MDWLDNYLDGLAQYKTTVSPSDTHIWGVKSTPNAQQKRMLFDAAAQSELEYRLIVQEARQAEIDAGMGGSYDAGSAAKEGPATPATPSGIPVASTASVVIGNVGGNAGTYVKKVPEEALIINSSGHNSYLKTGVCYHKSNFGEGNLLLSPNAEVWDDEIGAIIGSPFGVWKLITGAQFDADSDSWVYYDYATNASTDTAYIPDASWSPSITITAA